MKVSPNLGYAVVLLAVGCPMGAATASGAFEVRRDEAIESAIQGCTRAIEDQAVAVYMKRREDAGNPAASEDEARAEIESMAGWKEQLLPALRRDCSCFFEAPLSDMRNARTEDELDAVMAKMGRDMQTPSFLQGLESKASSCLPVKPNG